MSRFVIVLILVAGGFFVLGLLENSGPARPPGVSSERLVSPDAFALEDARAEWISGRMYFVAELVNEGEVPAGARVEIHTRDERGRLVATYRDWPAGLFNLEPGASVAARVPIGEASDPPASFEYRVTDAVRW